MPVNLKGRSLLTLRDFTPEEITWLIDFAIDLKAKKRSGIGGRGLEGRNIILIFEKASTRTRCAFEVAAFDEGGRVTFLTNSQMGKKESIEDTAKVLGRYYDGIEFRGFEQKTAELMAKYAGVPVWNGLTDLYHPTQVLADFMTLKEHLQRPFRNMKLAFVGDARNNMGNSLMIGAAKLGLGFTAVAPKELFPAEDIVSCAKKTAAETGARIAVTSDIAEGVKGADAVYTDVWVSMGEEEKFAERIALLKPYKVDAALMAKTGNSEALFLHCLPAFHDCETETAKLIARDYGLDSMEVSDDVFRSRHSVVFDEAENRMHTIKAIMLATIGN
ncbi:MAG: ornithine carbamoyltransferase [Spirochaeta sp. LUC14_002_19_P3]|nr:MAG: ornithine carbamoyltransferase [Spirochaeta sp. LUC14_002_19_P3]